MRRPGALLILVAAAVATPACEKGERDEWQIGHVPVAVNDQWVVSENETLSVPADGVLANDSFAQGGRVILVSPPPVGTLSLSSDGSFAYQPPANYFGVTTFSYAVETAKLSQPATVTIEVDRLFSVELGSNFVDLVQGSTVDVPVTTASGDPVQPPASITVSVSGLPAGVTVAPITISAGATGTLSFQATAAAAQTEPLELNVTSTSPLSATQSAPLPMRVRGPPGAIDTTFGDSGFVHVPSYQGSAAGVVTGPGGKVVAAITARNPVQMAAPWFGILMLNEDGTFDTAHSSEGIAFFVLRMTEAAKAIDYSPDIGLVVAGVLHAGVDRVANMHVALYGEPAPLFPTYSYDLCAKFGLASCSTTPSAARFLADTRLMESGELVDGASSMPYIARYAANGDPDASFGSNQGLESFSWTGNGDDSVGLVVDSLGRTLVAGNTADSHVGVACFDASGQPDVSFNGSGLLTADAGVASSITILDDGATTVVGGSRGSSPATVAVALAFDSTGGRVASFGSNGAIVLGALPSEDATAIATDGAGNIVLVGRALVGSRLAGFIARFRPDGTPDTGFNGTSGAYPTYQDPTQLDVYPAAVAIDALGRIVVAGRAGPEPGEILLFRVWP